MTAGLFLHLFVAWHTRSLHVLLHRQRHTIFHALLPSVSIVLKVCWYHVINRMFAPIVRKRSQRGKKLKDPKRGQMRENERAMEATQNQKNKIKERERGEHYYPLNSHLCFKVALVLQVVESFLCTTCFNLWGSSHYRTWFAYSNDEPPQKCSSYC